jgi:hypothetical protein
LGWYWQREQVLRESPFWLPLCLPHTSHALTWYHTLASPVNCPQQTTSNIQLFCMVNHLHSLQRLFTHSVCVCMCVCACHHEVRMLNTQQTSQSMYQPTNACNKIQFVTSLKLLHLLALGCHS